MAPRARKIAILGGRSVGKSSLTVQYVENHFAETYYPTIENSFQKLIKYKGNEYQAEIMDTAGQDEFSILSSKHAVGIHGYILVYSISSRQSFEICSVIREKLLDLTGMESIPLVLVANKVDLHSQRQVSTEEGLNLAKSWGCSFIEASAKHNQNISRVFEQILQEIEKNRADSVPTVDKSAGCAIL